MLTASTYHPFLFSEFLFCMGQESWYFTLGGNFTCKIASWFATATLHSRQTILSKEVGMKKLLHTSQKQKLRTSLNTDRNLNASTHSPRLFSVKYARTYLPSKELTAELHCRFNPHWDTRKDRGPWHCDSTLSYAQIQGHTFHLISHGFTAAFLLSCPATESTLAVGEGTEPG